MVLPSPLTRSQRRSRLCRHAAVCFGALALLGLVNPRATADEGSQQGYHERLVVDAARADGATTRAGLIAGVTYEVTVSGTYRFSGPREGSADAECATGGADVAHQRERYDGGRFDLRIQGADVHWEPAVRDLFDCSIDHVYRVLFVPAVTGRASFTIHDPQPTSSRAGELTVDVAGPDADTSSPTASPTPASPSGPSTPPPGAAPAGSASPAPAGAAASSPPAGAPPAPAPASGAPASPKSSASLEDLRAIFGAPPTHGRTVELAEPAGQDGLSVPYGGEPQTLRNQLLVTLALLGVAGSAIATGLVRTRLLLLHRTTHGPVLVGALLPWSSVVSGTRARARNTALWFSSRPWARGHTSTPGRAVTPADERATATSGGPVAATRAPLRDGGINDQPLVLPTSTTPCDCPACQAVRRSGRGPRLPL